MNMKFLFYVFYDERKILFLEIVPLSQHNNMLFFIGQRTSPALLEKQVKLNVNFNPSPKSSDSNSCIRMNKFFLPVTTLLR